MTKSSKQEVPDAPAAAAVSRDQGLRVYSVAGVTVGWRVNEIQLGEHIDQYATLILGYCLGLRSQAAEMGPGSQAK